ncbi:hypothetical protein [Vineibacter terrae]
MMIAVCRPAEPGSYELPVGSLDHLVGAAEEREREREAEHLGGFEVDHQFVLGIFVKRDLRSAPKEPTPVALPPGRLKLATSPSPTGSSQMKTIGMVRVAFLAASAGALPGATMTAT